MKNLAETFKNYLGETLGIFINPGKWEGVDRLPFFLRDFYTFFEVSLPGTPCLLMVARDEAEQTPAAIRKHMAQVQERWGHEVIYVAPAVSAYNRKRLIEQKVPFVVPGNQMYLPPLGIDLREHFRKIRLATPRFSPSTQAVVLHALLCGAEQSCTPSGMANRLGYTVMTLTRAFDEVESAGLGEVVKEGRERVLRFGEAGKALWEKARQLMRSPVKRRAYLRPLRNELPGPAAGLTALARYTLLTPPSHPVCALSSEDWKALKQRNEIVELALPAEPEACEVEIWSYAPRLFAEGGIVDRFSLFLSLQDDADERVQSALEKMMEGIAW